AIPLHVPTHNGLMRLIEINGVWQVQILCRRQWDAVKLSLGHDLVEEVRRGDFDDDGNEEIFLALRHGTTSQLLISNLTDTPEVESAYFEAAELTGVAQNTPVYSTFASIATP